MIFITYVRKKFFQSGQSVVVSSRGQVSGFGCHVRDDGHGDRESDKKQNGQFTGHRRVWKVSKKKKTVHVTLVEQNLQVQGVYNVRGKRGTLEKTFGISIFKNRLYFSRHRSFEN